MSLITKGLGGGQLLILGLGIWQIIVEIVRKVPGILLPPAPIIQSSIRSRTIPIIISSKHYK